MKSPKITKPKRAPRKKKLPRTQAEHQEDVLDQALSDSFPASDPISMTEPAPRDDERRPSPDEERSPAP